MTNDGSYSEGIFDQFVEGHGKNAYLYQFYDKKFMTGLNQRRQVAVPKQPSDRLIVLNGETFFAEVKSSASAVSFPFSNIKPGQLGNCRRVTSAGGDYRFFLHNLTTDQWYQIPGSLILQTLDQGRKSLKWDQIKEYTHEQLSGRNG